MVNWSEKYFNEISKVQGGFAFKSDEYQDDGALLVRIGNLQKGRISKQNSVYVTDRLMLQLKNFVLSENDILIGLTGDLGKLAKVRKEDLPAILNQRVGRFFPVESVDSEFLYQLVSSASFQEKLRIFFEGGAQGNISPTQIESIRVLTPNSKTEQSSIAEILSTADQAIEQTEQLIGKYQRIKTGLMQDLLTNGIDEQGNIRSKATDKFVVKNGMRVPEDWDADCLEKYINLHNNLRKPISSTDRFEMVGEYPYYGATGIIDSINEFRIEGKYVLIGEDGDHFLKFEKQDMTHLVDGRFNVSNHAHILSGKNSCSTEWLHYFFCNRDITFYLTRQGAGRFKLNKASLLKLPIAVPSPDEQERIITVIQTFNENFQNEIRSLSKLNSIKSGLMQDLLSGNVRVK